ncbi:hypothetical protein [Flavobacterium okayamense]|uniref:Lipocalin-like domain-containing protein n=1 Tax=Flavobacterium okayamense TaxID=2830782 RepID=A0ABM7S6Z1_9FLAO|nr:hypothetical protein [Flavobacterium okayamense]BCY28499.1 hypothetical protein KK2020170_13670 [Flavobacterium okayamense]
MKLFLYIVSFLTFGLSFGQEKNFPDDFLGNYKGKLEIVSAKGKQEIDMEFHFTKTDTIGTYKYVLVYNNQPRNYFLIEKDKAKGQYIIDENNGILLQASVFDNGIFSMFEVNGSLITTTEKFYDDYMDFEIMFTNTNKVETTGKGTEEIPTVKVYPILGTQRARLLKQ